MDLISDGRLPAADRPPDGWPTPRSAYIHIPFCRHRCGYCNFSVVAGRDDWIDRFLDALDAEMATWNRPAVQTLFIGGGTPTHLGTRQLDRLLHRIRDQLTLADRLEWSIEANPEDINPEKLDLLVSHGVNRISLGVQSFDDRKLQTLERGHSGRSAAEAIGLAADRVGNVAIDLIFAAPGETIETWRRDLATALQLPIRHLSTYWLTFEKGTSFWSRRHHGQLRSPGETLELEMYQCAREMAAAAGLEHYEISNFAKPGSRCRHNLAYWDGRGWYAAGPGAARFVDGRREVNHRSTSAYLKRIEAGQDPTAECESITTLQYARERAAFGVRMIDGIDTAAIARDAGIPVADLLGSAMARSLAEDLLRQQGDRVRLTETGIRFADTVASRFLGED